MHTTKIEIFKIAQTRVNWTEVNNWLVFIGVREPLEIIKQLGTYEGMELVDFKEDCGAGVNMR